MGLLNTPEKRKLARISLKSRISAYIQDTPDQQCPPSTFFEAIGKNIGIEGIQFTSGQQLKPGKNLMMDIQLPDENDTIKVKGQIRWCAEVRKDKESTGLYDTGVKFLKIDKSHMKMLIKYICGTLSEELICQA